jgi:cytoskeleton protein RodZ
MIGFREGESPGMTAIGETLRCERVRRNLELQQISRELKISSRFLDAIEREAFDELPGAIFVKSFVRQYARFLGLDEDEMAAEAQRIMEPAVAEPPAWNRPMPPVEHVRVPPMRAWGSVGDGGRFRWSSSLPALGLVVVAMLVCSFVYAWWQRERRSAAAPAAQTTASARPAPVPAAPPAASPPDAGQTPAGRAGPTTEAQAAPAGAAGDPSAGPPANVPPAAPPPAVEQPSARQTAPAAKGPVHVQITALTATWVRARTDGKYAFSGTLDPNQTRAVDAQDSVELLLGDAAGVSVELNGKPIGALGPKGQVRTLQLGSGGFKIVSAKAAAPADPL